MTHRLYQPLLSDKQWKRIEPLLPALPTSKKGGRPWASNRAVLKEAFCGSYVPEPAGKICRIDIPVLHLLAPAAQVGGREPARRTGM